MMVRYVRVFILVVVACAAWYTPAMGSDAADDSAKLRSMAVEGRPSGPVLHVRTTGDVETVHYSPQPGVWVVEMPESAFDGEMAPLNAGELGVERAEVARVDEFGKSLTRLTVWLAEPTPMDLVNVPDGFDLAFDAATESLTSAQADSPVADVAGDLPNSVVSSGPATGAVDDDGGVDETIAAEPGDRTAGDASGGVDPAVEPGHNLRRVVPVAGSEGVSVRLSGDGRFEPRAFTLTDPQRLVLDLSDVVCRVDQRLMNVNAAGVRRVRAAQFRAVPEPVTRVVLDLDHPVEYTIRPSESGAVLEVGRAPQTVSEETLAAADAEVAPMPAKRSTVQTSQASGTIEVLEAPARVSLDEVMASAALHQSEQREPTSSGSNRTVGAKNQQAVSSAAKRSVEIESPVGDPFTARDEQLVEEAAASEILELPGEGQRFETTEVESEETEYTGEPLSLRLKDADIKDVLRTFSSLTGLNIVVDPGVSGSVTVELHDVPWDQALDLILKINGLDYVIENNVMRVAPTSRLAGEKKARAALLREQERAKPLKMVAKPLSFAKASEVAQLVSGEAFLLSDRGSILVDERTNTLIIRDNVDRVQGILRLIDTLDEPAPQVMIEARIVETTRTFSHQLGVSWGFAGTMDTAHGNDTGLQFPNSASMGGVVNFDGIGALPAGSSNPWDWTLRQGTIGFSFGDILNTFNLDFILSAAESNGLVRIVSSPRVLAQNNMSANISSGIQLPVQTVANNTVTVQYIDATLELDVTPQITAEGAIMLEVSIAKREPAQALIVTGATNAPIFTRDAQTQLLVRDGGTTVIGGIYELNDQSTENKVPGLAELPLIGRLFRSKNIDNSHDELLIFITPRIVKY